MSTPPLHVIILAAGQGTRMLSETPKVLHRLAGRPLLEWVTQAVSPLSPAAIHVIYGQKSDALQAAIQHPKLHWIHQAKQEGTAHAVLQVLPVLPDDAQVLILSGDVPLIRTETLSTLVTHAKESLNALTLLVARPADPTGYGRIVRDAANHLQGIIEEKDATPAQRLISEIYTGICVAPATLLKQLIPQITPHNAQREYYLTDLVALSLQQQHPVQTDDVANVVEVRGVNTRAQLLALERYWQQQFATELLAQGVGIADTARIDIRGPFTAAPDVWIDINAVFEGEVTLGAGCIIGPNCVLKEVTLGAHTQVLANSVLEGVITGEHCIIGPFARLRPGTQLAEHTKVGNFVEVKNTQLGAHSKANHLSYLGDATIGEHVNVGAGTITCNYDGVSKHPTSIDDHVFIGSGTQLIAPIHIGEHATIGAGTTIRSDVPADALALSERPQKIIPHWKRKKAVAEGHER